MILIAFPSIIPSSLAFALHVSLNCLLFIVVYLLLFDLLRCDNSEEGFRGEDARVFVTAAYRFCVYHGFSRLKTEPCLLLPVFRPKILSFCKSATCVSFATLCALLGVLHSLLLARNLVLPVQTSSPKPSPLPPCPCSVTAASTIIECV